MAYSGTSAVVMALRSWAPTLLAGDKEQAERVGDFIEQKRPP
jgi:hypothetical protein